MRLGKGKECKLLALAPMYQPNMAKMPIALLVVGAMSNRMLHLAPLVPSILQEINCIQPRKLRSCCFASKDKSWLVSAYRMVR